MPRPVGFRISRRLLASRPRRSTPSGGFAAAILLGGGPGGGRRGPLRLILGDALSLQDLLQVLEEQGDQDRRDREDDDGVRGGLTDRELADAALERDVGRQLGGLGRSAG